MSVLNRDDYVNSLKSVCGDKPTDEQLTFMENMVDTFDDLHSKANDTTDWKSKYEECDSSWRAKYTERFYSPTNTQPTITNVEDEVDNSDIKISDLFK